MKSKEQREYIEAKAKFEAIVEAAKKATPELTQEILADENLLSAYCETEARIESELGWNEAWDRKREAETAVIDWMIRKLEADVPDHPGLETIKDAQNIIAQGFESGEKFAAVAIRL